MSQWLIAKLEGVVVQHYIPPVESIDIRKLLANHRKGFSLDQAYYTHPDIFEAEYKHIISRQWQYVDHINRIPKKGDYLLFKIAGEEIIVIRGDGETVYAHFNVCRHRGSRICTTETGHAKRLVCPYHAWSYRLDGSLANARAMAADFDPARFGLFACQVRVFEGLIFINLTPEGETEVSDFEAIADAMRPWVQRADLRNSKILAHEAYPAQVNWKIVLENYFECYHCVTSHPELCKVQLHTLRDAVGTDKAIDTFAQANVAWETKAKALGHMTGSMRGNFGLPDGENYSAQGYYAERMLIHNDLDGAYAKANGGLGKLPSKVMGSYAEDDGGQVDWGILPSAFLYTSCTQTVIMRLTPIHPLKTDVTMTWFVHPDAEDGLDYDVESAIWLDVVTHQQDEEIVRNTQAGVQSRVYQPGPYAELEGEILQVHDDYMRRLKYGISMDDVEGR